MSYVGMGATDTNGTDAVGTYGQRVARGLLDSVAGLPNSIRTKTLKAAMDRIDPTLYSRAEVAARPLVKAGLPPAAALERGIASAVSTGFARELVDLGRGKAPQKRSQLGMVLYGLGATASKVGLTPSGLPAGLVSGPAHTPGECTTDGKYIWGVTAAGTGYWSSLRVGQVCTSIGTTPSPTAGGAQGGVVITGCTDPTTKAVIDCPPGVTVQPPQAGPGKMLNVGPFFFPIASKQVTYHTLSDEQSQFITSSALSAMLAAGNVVNSSQMTNGVYPFSKFTYPDDASNPNSGKIFGLYYNKDDGTVTYKEYVTGDSIFTSIWNAIKSVAAAIVDVVETVVNAVKDAACSLLSGPAGKVAGAAAGAVVAGPAGAQAGAMGAQVAAQSCAATPPTCPPGQMIDVTGKVCVTVPPQKSSLLPIILIGGAGLAAVLLLTHKRKS